MKKYISFLAMFLFFQALSCFGGGVDKRGSVTGYRNATVLTEGGSFRVGSLPSTWQKTPFSYRAILFTHWQAQASISVDAFCKGSADDGPLTLLARQLFYGLSNQRIHLQKKLRLDGREAVRSVVSGALDGADVTMDAVVLKMNECVFDFVYTSNPRDYKLGVHDFENFYEGFHYISGPPLH